MWPYLLGQELRALVHRGTGVGEGTCLRLRPQFPRACPCARCATHWVPEFLGPTHSPECGACVAQVGRGEDSVYYSYGKHSRALSFASQSVRGTLTQHRPSHRRA